jgi:hypothetical protein
MHQLADGTLIVGPPKTDAGRRTIAIPPRVVPDLVTHLDEFVGPRSRCLGVHRAKKAARCGRMCCGKLGWTPRRPQASRVSICTTFGPPATRGLRRRGHRPRNRWPEWVTPTQPPPGHDSTPLPIGTRRSPRRGQSWRSPLKWSLSRRGSAAHAMHARWTEARRATGAPARAPDQHVLRERARGIEPPFSAWEADVLPLNYAREILAPA